MRRALFPRLAFRNLGKNKKFYIPYLLTGIFTVSMFYNLCFLTYSDDLERIPGGANIQSMMGFGTIVIALFSAIFLFYTNSFLMKRRQKELGLYNILGMEKKHIARVICYETLVVAIASIGGGLLVGIVLSKLLLLLLLRILGKTMAFAFTVTGKGLTNALILFAVIYGLTLLSNLLRLERAKPIELLKGGNVGEREPKTKGLLAILGAGMLGAGYFIALTTESPISALGLFFVAVLLVILGTYCLFVAGSIAVLKLLKKNKKFYYTPKHFTSVSGMLYRMKQNAVGLASICILSTMVLVTLSTTVCMYMGVEEELEARFPTDVSISSYYTDKQDAPNKEAMLADVNTVLQAQGRSMEGLEVYNDLSVTMGVQNGQFVSDQKSLYESSAALLTFITAEEYSSCTGAAVPELGAQDILLWSGSSADCPSEFQLFGTAYHLAGTVDAYPKSGDYFSTVTTSYYFVVRDQAALDQLFAGQREAFGENTSSYQYHMAFNLNGTYDEKLACEAALGPVLSERYHTSYVECKEQNRDDFNSTYGGLFFLGLFLAFLFLMATGLIIYYKQISEGYDDQYRFTIMQQVGMSREEVRKTIGSQVLMVFFLPLIVAVIHLAGAFKMITKLLALLNLTNVGLFALSCAGTIVIFAAVYGLVYVLTSRVYYGIVRSSI